MGLRLTDAVFDASTLSQNRRRYQDSTVAQAIAHGLVDGMVLYTDSTHLKANANKNRYDKAVIAKSRTGYWDDLDAAIDADRAAHGKSPLKPKEHKPEEKEIKNLPHRSAEWLHDARRQAHGLLLTRSSHGGWAPRHHHRHLHHAGKCA